MVEGNPTLSPLPRDKEVGEPAEQPLSLAIRAIAKAIIDVDDDNVRLQRCQQEPCQSQGQPGRKQSKAVDDSRETLNRPPCLPRVSVVSRRSPHPLTRRLGFP